MSVKFGTKQDIEAPIEFVFAQITDFKLIERAAMRRGAEVQRIDSLTGNAPGMAWEAKFEWRGKTREVALKLTKYDPPNGLVMGLLSPNLEGVMLAELVALSRARTRVALDLDLEPRTLSAKLLVQSMKLARKTLLNRMQQRMASYAEEIERRYKQSA